MDMTKPELLETLAAIDDCQRLAEMYCASSEDPEKQEIIEATLLKRCHTKLLNRALAQLSSDPEMAQDTTQEALVRILKNLPDLCDRDVLHFNGWMYTILDHLIKDHFRRQKYRREYLARLKQQESGTIRLLDSDLDRIDQIVLQAAVQQLRPDRRRIVEDYLAGWEVKDIAEDHNLPPDEVSRILYRAKQDLKEILRLP